MTVFVIKQSPSNDINTLLNRIKELNKVNNNHDEYNIISSLMLDRICDIDFGELIKILDF